MFSLSLPSPSGLWAHLTTIHFPFPRALATALTTFDSAPDYINFALLLSIPFALYWAVARHRAQQAEEHGEQELISRCRDMWRSATGFRRFFALAECWTWGSIPWGPWPAKSIQNRWRDRTYLRRICRGGIVPFHIALGGVQMYRKGGFRARGWDVEMPTYVQSKGRAHFEFLVLFPLGYLQDPIPERDRSRRRFVDGLLGQEEYAVTVSWWHLGSSHRRTEYSVLRPTREPLEVGAESWAECLLPFKSDRVLRRGKGVAKLPLVGFVPRFEVYAPVLARYPCAIVRVEALDYAPHRLDEWVFEVMREASVGDIWAEDELSRALGKMFRRFGIDFEVGHELTES